MPNAFRAKKRKLAAEPIASVVVPAPVPVAAAPVRHRAPRPAPPNPTVIAFQQQLVPLVEKREIIQQHVRAAQRALQEAQMTLQNDQQALQDTENAINYRLNMIAQLTGQPQQPLPPPTQLSTYGPVVGMSPYRETYGSMQQPYNPQIAPQYAGEEVNLMGSPNIPSNITSIPAPQNQRWASGYVPTGESNPRSESAVDVRNDPATRDVMLALAEARKQMSVV